MSCPIPFHVDTVCKSTNARVGRLELRRGVVQTPVFMPVGTQGALRGMAPIHLPDTGAQIILANTYHLHQRPGEAIVQKLGGLHRFMGVDLPILTDSGGFQVFSLDKKQVSEEGVMFNYAIDGKRVMLSPERSMAIQQALGSDIAMAFDECLPADASHAMADLSVDLTARWAERCLSSHTREDQSLFGIVQGAMFQDLRRRSVEQITSLPFDGYAIGGLSVGEGPDKMNEVLAATMPYMPPGMPRYLMGVGRPQDLVDGVALGVDMFDCVIPTRHARSGSLYTFQGRIRITHGSYRRDSYPIDTACGCYTCTHFSRAYLHHLFEIGEILGATLATIHNLRFFGDLMARIRAAIADGTFATLRKDVKALYPEPAGGVPSEDIGSDDVDEPRAGDARARMAKKARPATLPAYEPRRVPGRERGAARASAGRGKGAAPGKAGGQQAGRGGAGQGEAPPAPSGGRGTRGGARAERGEAGPRGGRASTSRPSGGRAPKKGGGRGKR